MGNGVVNHERSLKTSIPRDDPPSLKDPYISFVPCSTLPYRRGDRGSDHVHAVADGVLPVDVLHRADHAGKTLSDGGNQQRPIRQNLMKNLSKLHTGCNIKSPI